MARASSIVGDVVLFRLNHRGTCIGPQLNLAAYGDRFRVPQILR